MTKVIGFCGSPRKNGNTDFLMQTILTGAEAKGYETELISLNKVDIGFCTACDACRKKGNGCVQKDDMQSFEKKMTEADVWVIGTPVYWWGPTAQMKVFIDRWYGFSHETFQNKKIILVVPMEDTEEKTASYVVGMFKESCYYIGIEIIDIIVAKGVHEAGAVKSRPDIIKQAEEAVKKI